MKRRAFAQTLVALTASSLAMPGAIRAQTPVASPVSTAGIRYAAVPGTALALSPDGTMLAGIVDRNRIVVWSTDTLDTVAESAPLDEISLIDETSLTWSPDSSALAWSLLAAVQLRDSDIYVFDVDTGEIMNLTDDDPMDRDAPRLPIMDVPDDFQPLNVDILPSWTADGENLVFARSIWGSENDAGTSLMRIPREGGEPTEIAVMSEELAFLPNSIHAGMEDGSVLYSTWPPRPDSPEHGVFLVTPDSEIETIATGPFVRETPYPVLLDIAPADRKAVIVSAINVATLDRAAGPTWAEMDLDTGIPTAFEEVLSLPTEYSEAIREDLILHGSPAFLTAPDGTLEGYLYATTDANYDTVTLWRYRTSGGEAELLGTFMVDEADARPSRTYNRVEIGANGTAAVFHGGNAWLASVDG
jgi:WD40 repeat protein